ncbi:sigma factor-like helix-turn-helix DNA-binding protein [Streptomyces sp. NPDC048338]|uniref:sigma factor-like helix-turn-helix DNA-binding protein n=1 Tax=Streptomyces sp. NPDC048338 TaxID=3365536 RepID=UPI003717798A
MRNDEFLDRQFGAHEARLRAVARRMLGSRREAEDALAEARAGVGVGDVAGWLTMAVGRVCLARLRARTAGGGPREDGRESPGDGYGEEAVRPGPASGGAGGQAPPDGVADSVTLALFVVLESLTPDERLAFVLHELFGLPLDETARITGLTAAEAARLVRHGRLRVRGGGTTGPRADAAAGAGGGRSGAARTGPGGVAGAGDPARERAVVRELPGS